MHNVTAACLCSAHCKLTWSWSGLGSSVLSFRLGLLLLFLLLLDAVTAFGGQ